MLLSDLVYLPKVVKSKVNFIRKAKDTLTKEEKALINALDAFKLNQSEENKAALMKLIEETRGE